MSTPNPHPWDSNVTASNEEYVSHSSALGGVSSMLNYIVIRNTPL